MITKAKSARISVDLIGDIVGDQAEHTHLGEFSHEGFAYDGYGNAVGFVGATGDFAWVPFEDLEVGDLLVVQEAAWPERSEFCMSYVVARVCATTDEYVEAEDGIGFQDPWNREELASQFVMALRRK